MITQEDLKNLIHLKQEINQIQDRIDRYKPVEIVVDSVRGSSPVFPFTEHTIKIEGLEKKDETLTKYYRSLQEYKEKLETEERRIEKEIEKIPFSEIRQIIRLHYLEGLSYVQVMHIMKYNAPETPRFKIKRFLKKNYYDI